MICSADANKAKDIPIPLIAVFYLNHEPFLAVSFFCLLVDCLDLWCAFAENTLYCLLFTLSNYNQSSKIAFLGVFGKMKM